MQKREQLLEVPPKSVQLLGAFFMAIEKKFNTKYDVHPKSWTFVVFLCIMEIEKIIITAQNLKLES